MFAKDRHGKSTCTGACAGFWPPLIASGKPLVGAGVKSTLLGTTRRAYGRQQITYKGDTNGEELNVYGVEWYALSAPGTKVERDNAGTSGTGYGY